MALLLLLVNVSKVVGVAGVLTVAVNALAYRHFQKKNLGSFENPINEDEEILAAFPIDKAVEDGGFFFALATAAVHVEDKLNDAWLEFAKQQPEKEPGASLPSEKGEVAEGDDKYLHAASTQKEPMESNFSEGSDTVHENVILHESKVLEKRGDADQMLSEGSHLSDSSGRYSPTLDSLSDWEVLGSNKGRGSQEFSAELYADNVSAERENSGEPQPSKDSQSKLLEEPNSNTEQVSEANLLGQQSKDEPLTEEPILQYNLPQKGKIKVSTEATMRGIKKFSEDDEDLHTVAQPEERVRFWSDPDTELRLAQQTNVTIFRMGVDWSRIMPAEPIEGLENVVDWKVLHRYRWILERVHAHGMRVMLTLFHHSVPPWAAKYGGWKDEKTIGYFLQFTRLAVQEFSHLVDYWITFNEPHVFAMLTYCTGVWPGGNPDLLERATSIMPPGVFNKVMGKMAEAHLKAYDMIHDLSTNSSKRTKVGISHHVSFMRPHGLFDVPAIIFTNWRTRFAYVDSVRNKLDFIGINYCGQEIISATGLKLAENEEFSECGQGIYPDGLYRLLLQFHERYKDLNLPFIITENGVSDATDYIRRPYILEHLLAVRAAMDKGVPVHGYCYWTLSDSWEGADGYGPKFGLAAVDCEHNLECVPRPSYHLFAEVAKSGKVTKEQRVKAWDELQTAAGEGKVRPFYRAVDQHGLMYAGRLDVPMERPFIQRDWRFGHYQVDGLQDPLSFAIRTIWNGSRFQGKDHSKSRSLSD